MSGAVNIRLDVAYDGSAFHGFARNTGVRTVQGDLEAALERVLREEVQTVVAGRTDRGVHATGQVVSFTTSSSRLDVDRLARSLTALCGPAIAVLRCAVVDDDFHARFSARSRRYRYRVLNRDVHDPVRVGRVWHVREPLDLASMNRAAEHLVGEHDFASLCRRPKDQPDASLVRSVTTAVWQRHEDEVVFEVRANAFCHQMVRSMTALLVSVGRGTRPAESVPDVLAARDRAAAPSPAPPEGLTLIEVEY